MVHTISDAREVLAAVPTDMGVLYSRIVDKNLKLDVVRSSSNLSLGGLCVLPPQNR
jgi:hypothetical protein